MTGLVIIPTCRSTEGNTNGASVLKDLHMLMQEHGFEGVFIIRTRSGATINMFKTPGLVTENMIANWVADLLQRGVWDDNGFRLPLCPWDMLICKLAFRTIINSCSDALRQDFIDRTDPEKRVGPWTLFIMMTKVYRPDLTKLENLKKALKALSILSFEAQSVTLYKQSASALVREIQMISTTEHPIPDLAIATIAGLAASGVTKFHLSVTSKMTELNRKPTDAPDAQVALNLLDDFEAEYISLVQMNLYPPALKPDAETQKYKAMQAEVSYISNKRWLNSPRTALLALLMATRTSPRLAPTSNASPVEETIYSKIMTKLWAPTPIPVNLLMHPVMVYLRTQLRNAMKLLRLRSKRCLPL